MMCCECVLWLCFAVTMATVLNLLYAYISDVLTCLRRDAPLVLNVVLIWSSSERIC